VPSFTVAVPDLRAIGPIVEIRIAVPQAVEAIFASSGQPAPSPVSVTAMIAREHPEPSSRPASRLDLG